MTTQPSRPAPSAAPAERIKDLAEVPSFPAVYAAALRPSPRLPGRARSASCGVPRLPQLAYRVRSVVVDAGRARDFDHLMGGPATDLVHPGVLHVLAFPVALGLMARSEFPFSLLGLVHLRNQVLQHRPVRVGEKVDVVSRVRALAPHRRGWTFEAVSTIHGGDGEIIATDVSTYLAKGARGDEGPAGPASSDGAGADGQGAGERSRVPFEPPRPTGRWVLAADTGRRYAAVSGDANPIHLSTLSAKAFGFPRAIAHGMYTASRAFTEARMDLSQPLRWDVEFDAAVTLPSTVLVRFEDDAESGAVRCIGWRPPRGEKDARRCFGVEITTLG